jgi:DNA polymerase-3 subunit alpha
MKSFAAYSFNKSHACAYTLISYWCMYLKVYYPAIYLAAFMSCSREEKVFSAVREAKRLGVPVSHPDINISTNHFEYDSEDNAIIAPLDAVKGVGEKAAFEIMKAREGGVFLSFDDFKVRVYKRVVNKGVQKKLIMAGAFESLGIKEVNKELREKQMAELLPAFDTLPTLNLIRSESIDHKGLGRVHEEIKEFAAKYEKQVLKPLSGRSPVLMIVNGQMKGETSPGKARGTAPMLHRLSRMNIPVNSIYYTTPVKTYLDNPRKAPSDLQKLGLDWLKREVETVKPKLIYCCTTEAINVFVPGGKISKLYGQLKYNKEYDAYILFGPSPQYASFRPEEAGVKYEQCLAKIANMFEEAIYDL